MKDLQDIIDKVNEKTGKDYRIFFGASQRHIAYDGGICHPIHSFLLLHEVAEAVFGDEVIVKVKFHKWGDLKPKEPYIKSTGWIKLPFKVCSLKAHQYHLQQAVLLRTDKELIEYYCKEVM